MPRIRTKLHELSDADVKFVSLVSRGANRIPFRIVKSHKEPQMSGIDLSSIGGLLRRTQKSAPAVPEVAGIVVFDHGDNVNRAVKAALSANGFYTDRVQKFDDGTLMYAQASEMPKDGEFSIIRLSDQMAVAMKSFDSVAAVLTEASAFAPEMQAEGFFHGTSAAVGAFNSRVADITAKGEGSLMDVTAQFNEYVTALKSAVPEAVFKAEAEIAAAVKGDQSKGSPNGKEKPGSQDDDKGLGEIAGDGTAVNPAASSPATNDAFGQVPGNDTNGIANGAPSGGNGFGQIPNKDLPNIAKKDDTATGTTTGSVKDPDGDGDNDMADYCAQGGKPEDWKAMDADKRMAWSKGNKERKEKAELAAMIALAVKGALEPVTAQLGELSTSMQSVQKAQETTDSRIDAIARKAEDASKAVKGYVVAGAPADDAPAQGESQSTTQKSESPYTGCFDTALIRKHARRA